MRKARITKTEKGQAWVIMAVAVTVLIIFLGFAIDTAILFSNYTKLKRAVDAASVAAANEYKRKNGATTSAQIIVNMTEAADEILNMHEMDMSQVNLTVYMCDLDDNGIRDASLQATVPDFYNKCPDTPTQLPRKLVWIQASENAPTYFLHLIGLNSIPITTNSISEAAPIDLVLVMDTSESMGVLTPGYVPDDFDPITCNAATVNANKCHPLFEAKEAAKALVATLYDGYDRVAIVTFDQMAVTRLVLTDNMTTVNNAIDGIPLHDDAPGRKLFTSWYNDGIPGLYNPVNPEDRNGDGLDADNSVACNWAGLGTGDRWNAGAPCDDPTKLDAFDWNQNNTLDASDVTASNNWIAEARHNPLGLSPAPPMSVISTCTGCGIRVGTSNLVNNGRSNAVWVMVVLSDGVANLTDTPQTFPVSGNAGIPSAYPNGFCGGSINNALWNNACIKQDTTRYCINPTPIGATPAVPAGGNCPPTPMAVFVGSSPVSPPYTPEDYARDMVDRAALMRSTNSNERSGNDMAIYSIGFGNAAIAGEPLLRYMAAVGDDGQREPDPCVSTPSQTSCGQYYFAANSQQLLPIFEDIASRIYTKISY
jgi:hypothetical protein